MNPKVAVFILFQFAFLLQLRNSEQERVVIDLFLVVREEEKPDSLSLRAYIIRQVANCHGEHAQILQTHLLRYFLRDIYAS